MFFLFYFFISVITELSNNPTRRKKKYAKFCSNLNKN